MANNEYQNPILDVPEKQRTIATSHIYAPEETTNNRVKLIDGSQINWDGLTLMGESLSNYGDWATIFQIIEDRLMALENNSTATPFIIRAAKTDNIQNNSTIKIFSDSIPNASNETTWTIVSPLNYSNWWEIENETNTDFDVTLSVIPSKGSISFTSGEQTPTNSENTGIGKAIARPGTITPTSPTTSTTINSQASSLFNDSEIGGGNNWVIATASFVQGAEKYAEPLKVKAKNTGRESNEVTLNPAPIAPATFGNWNWTLITTENAAELGFQFLINRINYRDDEILFDDITPSIKNTETGSNVSAATEMSKIVVINSTNESIQCPIYFYVNNGNALDGVLCPIGTTSQTLLPTKLNILIRITNGNIYTDADCTVLQSNPYVWSENYEVFLVKREQPNSVVDTIYVKAADNYELPTSISSNESILYDVRDNVGIITIKGSLSEPTTISINCVSQQVDSTLAIETTGFNNDADVTFNNNQSREFTATHDENDTTSYTYNWSLSTIYTNEWSLSSTNNKATILFTPERKKGTCQIEQINATLPTGTKKLLASFIAEGTRSVVSNAQLLVSDGSNIVSRNLKNDATVFIPGLSETDNNGTYNWNFRTANPSDIVTAIENNNKTCTITNLSANPITVTIEVSHTNAGNTAQIEIEIPSSQEEQSEYNIDIAFSVNNCYTAGVGNPTAQFTSEDLSSNSVDVAWVVQLQNQYMIDINNIDTNISNIITITNPNQSNLNLYRIDVKDADLANIINSDLTINIPVKLKSFNVTLNLVNGTTNSNLTQTVNYNGTASWTITPNSGYTTEGATITNGTLNNNVVTSNAVTGNMTVSVELKVGKTPAPTSQNYFYVGTSKPTSLSQANTVESYTTEQIYTNNSGAKSHIFVLTNSDKNVTFIEPSENSPITQNDVDTTTISGYKIFETKVGVANTKQVKIIIS